jgi:branched-subunit amino acid aminotransferase/4-amino-4-deoxychorismate lyase
MKANGYVFLNGRIIDASRATISVYDRGILYGDGLFETMRAYKGVAFAIEDHFHRLRTSADILGLPIPNLDWPATIAALLDKNGLSRQDAWVRLTITRGPAEPRVLPPDLVKPTTIIMVRPLDRDIAAHHKRGVKVALLPFSRHGFIPEPLFQPPACRWQGAGSYQRLRYFRARRSHPPAGRPLAVCRARRRPVDPPRGR